MPMATTPSSDGISRRTVLAGGVAAVPIVLGLAAGPAHGAAPPSGPVP